MPNYTYTINRPDGNLTPSAQRVDLTNNTNSVNSILNVDMIGFNNNNGGFHSKVTFVVGSDPGSASGQVVQYSKTSSGSSELFLQRDGVAGAIQLTNGTVNIAGDALSDSQGHSFLPGGIIIQWGSTSASIAGTAFMFDIPFPNKIFSITGGSLSGIGGSVSFFNLSESGATATTNVFGGTFQANYIAIGN